MKRQLAVALDAKLTSRRAVVLSLLSSTALTAIPSLGRAAPGTGARGTHAPRPRFAEKVEQVKLELPPGKKLGSVVGVSRAPNGDIFLLHDVAWANPPVPEGEQLAPVVQLNSNFKFIRAWGGPDAAPAVDGKSQWPTGLDNIECDEEGNIWIGGYGPEDDAALRFSPTGQLLMRIGQRGRAGNDEDTQWLRGPVSFYVDAKNREVFIADGYGNHRIIAFNLDTGKYTRMWGAYGKKPSPPDPNAKAAYGSNAMLLTPSPTFGNPVHRIVRTPDGLVYVCDRLNNRVQEFELVPNGVKFLREVIIAPGTLLMGSAWDIAFTSDGRYMYVADSMSYRVWTVDRKSFSVMGWTNAAPEHEGDDNLSAHRSGLHRIQIESNGDLLLARTIHGLQRLKYLGVS
jgi:hypothetical protein